VPSGHRCFRTETLKQLIDRLSLLLNATEDRETGAPLDSIPLSAFHQPLGTHGREADNNRIGRQPVTHSMSLLGRNGPLLTTKPPSAGPPP